jgi:hypothetical protein
MSENNRPIPIYTTSGDPRAYLVYPYIYNRNGNWIGWMTSDRQVYSVHGKHIGWLGDGPRILRKRAHDYTLPDRQPPAPPEHINVPTSVPLAPLMSEITYGTIDVLEEAPQLLPTLDDFTYVDDMD